MNLRNFIPFLIALFISTQGFAAAAKKDIPTIITADMIDIKQKSHIMEFKNNVVVRKGQDSMMADHMTVLYEGKTIDSDPETPSSSNDSSIKRIDAKNHVKISTAEFVATGESGYYDPKAGFFVLDKNVVVNNGSSIANGDKFVYNLHTRKGNLTGQKADKAAPGADKRVVIVIHENELKKKKPDAKTDSKNKKSDSKQEN